MNATKKNPVELKQQCAQGKKAAAKIYVAKYSERVKDFNKNCMQNVIKEWRYHMECAL